MTDDLAARKVAAVLPMTHALLDDALTLDTVRRVDVPDLEPVRVQDCDMDGPTEYVELGPISGVYYRLAGADLLVVADDMHRIADLIIEAVLDQRQRKLDAERARCHWCGAGPLAEGEDHCGAGRCRKRYDDDVAAEARANQ